MCPLKTRRSVHKQVCTHNVIRARFYRDFNTHERHDEPANSVQSEALPYVWEVFPGSTETIMYSNSNGKSSNGCDHTRVSTSFNEVSGSTHEIIWSGGGGYTTHGEKYPMHYCEEGFQYAEVITGGFDIPVASPFSDAELYSLNLEDILYDHYESLKDPIENGTSLATFLIELKDGAAFFHLAKSLVDGVKVPEGQHGMSYEDVQNTAFSYQYALAPFVRELKKLSAYPEEYQRVKQSLSHSQRAPLTVRTAKSIDIDYRYGMLAEPKLFRDYSSHADMLLARDHGSARCWAVSKVGYDTRLMDNASLDTLAFNKAMGLTNPAKVAFDAIPFSWLLDNRQNLSKIVNKFDNLGAFASPRLLDASFHIKMQQKYRGFMYGNYWMDGTPLIDHQECCSSTQMLYKRWAGLPLKGNPSLWAPPPELANLHRDKERLVELYHSLVEPIRWVGNIFSPRTSGMFL